MRIKDLTLAAILGCVGCEPAPQKPKQYIEGEVINEAKSFSAYYPFAFSIKDKEGNFKSFDVGRYDAASVDALIDKGDIIKIDCDGVRNGIGGTSITGARYIQILEKAQ